jgi:GTPase
MALLSDEQKIAAELGAQVLRLRSRSEKGGEVVEVLVRMSPVGDDFQDIRVAVVGNVDAGKR